MKTKVESAIASLDKIPTSCELEEKLLSAAKSALVALRKYQAGSFEGATREIANVSRAADEAGIGLLGEVFEAQYGPFVQTPGALTYN